MFNFSTLLHFLLLTVSWSAALKVFRDIILNFSRCEINLSFLLFLRLFPAFVCSLWTIGVDFCNPLTIFNGIRFCHKTRAYINSLFPTLSSFFDPLHFMLGRQTSSWSFATGLGHCWTINTCSLISYWCMCTCTSDSFTRWRCSLVLRCGWLWAVCIFLEGWVEAFWLSLPCSIWCLNWLEIRKVICRPNALYMSFIWIVVWIYCPCCSSC